MTGGEPPVEGAYVKSGRIAYMKLSVNRLSVLATMWRVVSMQLVPAAVGM